MHGAPPAPGVHPLPQRRRARGAGGQADPRDPRQLRRPQASQGPRLARPSCALDLPLHADLLLLGQRRRDLFRHADPPPPATRRFHSLVDLQAAINRYLEEHHQRPSPSSGPPIPTASWKKSTEGTKRRVKPLAVADSHLPSNGNPFVLRNGAPPHRASPTELTYPGSARLFPLDRRSPAPAIPLPSSGEVPRSGSGHRGPLGRRWGGLSSQMKSVTPDRNDRDSGALWEKEPHFAVRKVPLASRESQSEIQRRQPAAAALRAPDRRMHGPLGRGEVTPGGIWRCTWRSWRCSPRR